MFTPYVSSVHHIQFRPATLLYGYHNYTGITHDFRSRLSAHNGGFSAYTAKGIPWEKVWLSDPMEKGDALRLERAIKKRGAGRYLSDIDR